VVWRQLAGSRCAQSHAVRDGRPTCPDKYPVSFEMYRDIRAISLLPVLGHGARVANRRARRGGPADGAKWSPVIMSPENSSPKPKPLLLELFLLSSLFARLLEREGPQPLRRPRRLSRLSSSSFDDHHDDESVDVLFSSLSSFPSTTQSFTFSNMHRLPTSRSLSRMTGANTLLSLACMCIRV
jgi:hypothetical protein